MKDKSYAELKEQFKDSPYANNKYKIIDDLNTYPEVNNNKPLDTYVNLKWLLKRFDADIKYNLMSRRREIQIPDHYIFKDDSENAALSRVNYLSTINGMPIKQLDKHLDVLAFENPYHPIREMIKLNPWDGIKRLDDFIKTIETTNDELAHIIIKTWMVSAIAAAHSEDGFINQGVLVLQGKQNIGKTRWVKALDPLNCNAVKEGAILDPANKDSIILLARHWIVELGELDATFRKADIARLKSFITMQADDIRFSYAIKETRLVRRTVYIATVNDEKFLSDETGNRRWWTLTVEKINNDHALNMIQVWAEAYNLWKDGHLPYLPFEIQEKVDRSNLDHEKVDPFKEKLNSSYDWESASRRWMCATEVLEELGFKSNRSDCTKIGFLLKILSNDSSRIRDGYREYKVPFLIKKTNYV